MDGSRHCDLNYAVGLTANRGDQDCLDTDPLTDGDVQNGSASYRNGAEGLNHRRTQG